MRKRGQVSMEYLIVMGFTLVIIGVTLVLFSQQNSEQRYQVQDSQINKIGNSIVQAAEEVYYLGEPSRKTITVYMPSRVQNITFLSNALVFNLILGTNLNQMEFPTEVPLLGNLSSSEGKKHIMIIAQPNRVCIVEEGKAECVS